MNPTIRGIRFRTQADGSLVCPHRDLSVCDACVNACGGDLIDVVGAHYEATPELAAALAR